MRLGFSVIRLISHVSLIRIINIQFSFFIESVFQSLTVIMLDVKKDPGESMWTLNWIFVVFPIIDGRQSGKGNVSVSIIFNFLSKIKTEKYHIPSVLLEKMLGMISPICKEFVGSSYIFAKYFAVLSSSSDYHGQWSCLPTFSLC